ncbi:MAG: bifunctional DNA primase/polymerase, partial [Deltaproteobacteria bacterium]|nr:bifunctional DNA primase/polymerase [Deltaproteobacteria bacterium]
MNDLSPAVAARGYLSRGWQITPVMPGGKQPLNKGWQKNDVTEPMISELFRDHTNIGIRLGTPSGGLVDVDIDSATCLRLTDLLPPTGLTHGRSSKKRSHFWYQIDGNPPQTIQFKHPVTGGMLIEIRSTGGQTVVPPSHYQIGGKKEKLTWDEFGSPGQITSDELRVNVSRIAAIALVADEWKSGSRHLKALALSGVLLRGGYTQAQAESFLRAVCEAAKDDEVKDRMAALSDTSKNLANNRPATGLPSLAALLGERVVEAIQNWLSLRAPTFNESFAWELPLSFDKINTPEIPADLLPGVFGEF